MDDRCPPRFHVREMVRVASAGAGQPELEITVGIVHSCSRDHSGSYSYDVCDLQTGLCWHLPEREVQPAGSEGTRAGSL
jgi:hypothetical protein